MGSRRRSKSSKRPRPKRRLKRKPHRLSKRAKRTARANRPTKAKRPPKGKRPAKAKHPKAGKVRPERSPASALEREVLRLRRARGRLERRLTEAVQEIGMLRQFEMRVQVLETEASRRDVEIAELRRERDERSREAGDFRGDASTS